MLKGNKYFRAFLIFLFFFWFIDGLVDGFWYLVAQLFDIGNLQEFNRWIYIASSLIVIALGIYFAVKRIRTDTPWKMTPFHKALVFGIIYYTIQLWWLVFSFAFHFGNTVPKTFLYIYSTASYVVRFPGIFLPLPLGQFGIFLNCIFWGTVFYYSFLTIEKIKSRKNIILQK
jgi:hypothetical protein